MKLPVRLMLLILWTATCARAQTKQVEMGIQFLTSEIIGEVNMDQETFVSYAQAVNAAIENAMTGATAKADVYVVQTVHKSQPATIEVFVRPANSGIETQKLKSLLLAIKSTTTNYVDFSLLYKAKVNGGAVDSEAAFTPALKLPAEVQMAEFQARDMAGEYAQIKAWAATEAIPLLAAFETKVDSKFAGVRAVGDMLTATNFSGRQDVAALTERSNSYWQACLEMSQGNQLIPVSKALMYAAQGEFDQASLYLTILQPLSDPKSMATQLAQELSIRLQVFDQKLNAEVQKGIARHDQGAYPAAIAIYNQVLAIHPASAWVNYEKYFSQNTQALAKKKAPDGELWKNARAVVYRYNPMYPTQAEASSGKEMYQMMKRQRLTELFQTKEKFEADYLEYADTALLLGDYGLAAQMNWLIFSSFAKDSQGSENRLAYFLYALDKLGNREIAANFKGDFKSEFARIDTRFDRDMRDNAMYKSFKN